MITVSEASARILERIHELAAETVATENAAGRVLADNVIAPVTSPPWDNSSMDGYAVRSADIAAGVCTLRVIESVAAGAFPARSLSPGEATRVMTGAPVPEGCDTVIRHEDTDNGNEVVTIRNLRDSRRNIRAAGEDFNAGDVLFQPGEPLRAAHAGVLASAGIKSVKVRRRPRVALISSGDELIALGDFTPDKASQRIVSSNNVTLAALIRDAGGEPADLGIAGDNVASLQGKLNAARDFDLIITTAGISVGDHDHVRTAFTGLGGVVDFWKVRMRPGAPLAFGTLDGVPWIGLSGNPVSAMVTFEIFVRPAIRKMLGFKALFRETIPVRLTAPLAIAAPLMHFLRVVVNRAENGEYMVESAGSQSSSVLTTMARANALLILPGDRLEFARGETFRALPLGDTLQVSENLVLS